jgi:succinyl-diaminopimelate desuccinylase
MPQLGINAIELMRLFLNELTSYNINAETDKLLGCASMSINKIIGGSATNIVPDRCFAQIDIRTLPQYNHALIIRDFEEIFSKLSRQNAAFRAELNVIRSVPALNTEANCAFVSQLKKSINKSEVKTVSFTTDAPFVAQLNIPTVIFGPGNPELCHKPNEFIETESFCKAIELYKQIILDLQAVE